MARRHGSSLGLRLSWGNGERQALSMRIKWAADFSRHFYLALNAPPSDQSRVELGENIGQGQADQHAVTIILGGENVGSSLSQFTKRNLYGTARELREHFFQGNSDGRLANIIAANAWLQFQRQALENTLQVQLNAFAVTIWRGAILTQGRSLKNRRLGSLRTSVLDALECCVLIVLRRCLRRLAQKVFYEAKHFNFRGVSQRTQVSYSDRNRPKLPRRSKVRATGKGETPVLLWTG